MASKPAKKDDTLDLLEQIGVTGARSASSALTLLMKKRVDAYTPQVQIIPVTELKNSTLLKDSSVGVYLPVRGGRNTLIAVLFDRDNTLRLIDALDNKPSGTTVFIGEYNQSVIKEVGNILGNAYLHALGEKIGIEMIALVPKFVFGLTDPLDVVAENRGASSLVVIMIENQFEIRDVRVNGKVVFFMDEADVETAFGKHWESTASLKKHPEPKT